MSQHSHPHTMNRNHEFARPIDDGRRLEYAPVILPPSPHAPTEAEYNAAGWYRLEIAPPEPPEGTRAVGVRYDVDNNVIVAIYTYEVIPMPALSEYDDAMEAHLKAEREARGYTTREPDAYLTSSVTRWAQDAADWVAHRDAVMEYALALINAVQSGEREPPTMEEFKEGLPRISWTIDDSSSASSGSDSSPEGK